MNPLTETWQIHNRINLYLLDSIDEAYLADLSASKGRTVGEQFAHMHNVRLMWLKASEPALLNGLEKIEKEQISKESIRTALAASAHAIEQLFENTTPEGKIKGFKP